MHPHVKCGYNSFSCELYCLLSLLRLYTTGHCITSVMFSTTLICQEQREPPKSCEFDSIDACKFLLLNLKSPCVGRPRGSGCWICPFTQLQLVIISDISKFKAELDFIKIYAFEFSCA
ncbi:hypothetical protein GBA52_001724 [Prunus armeniaca]|nr:hypothetical protein GBA52_001724 [Prunus armeniaca]